MEAKQEEDSNNVSLQQVLQTHQLSDEYHTKMVKNGFGSMFVFLFLH